MFSDTHFPYHHPDCFEFLSHFEDIDTVVCVGDEIDSHSISFHTTDPDLYSPGYELEHAIFCMQRLYKMFPKVFVLNSNHGSLIFRRAKYSFLPLKTIRPINEILCAPKTWRWVDELILQTKFGPIYFHHGKTNVPGKLSQLIGMHAVQGHYHEKLQVRYWQTNLGMKFDCHVGCLVDQKSLAFEYAKNNLKTPALGAAIIENGKCNLHPMILDKHGRWIGT